MTKQQVKTVTSLRECVGEQSKQYVSPSEPKRSNSPMCDLSMGGEDVHDKGAEIDCVEIFGGVVKNGVVDIIDRRRELVACDGEDHLVCVPCLACGGIGGMQFLTFSCCGAYWDNWVGWRFNLWDVERLSVASQVDCWILKKAKVSLAVSPPIENCHEVSRQFADDHFDLFMGGFAKDTCEDRMRHLGLNAHADMALDIIV